MFQASRPPIVEPTALERASALQHSFEPSPRELRAQMVQRLQVGLFGLALMLLLVGLANIIMQHARQNDATMTSAVQSTSSATTAGNTDPLADIGVVPSPDASGKRGNAARNISSIAH